MSSRKPKSATYRLVSRNGVLAPAAPARRRRRARASTALQRVPGSSMSRLTRAATTLHPDARAYVNCLVDPFSNPPVKLGFGCMTASQLTTLTCRQIVSTSVDGSFSAYVIPSINGPNTPGSGGLYTSSTVAGDPLASSQHPWQNGGIVAATYEEARVISCGLRVTPMIPGTASPGGGFVASFPSVSRNQLESFTKANLITQPMFVWGMASAGATSTSRPIDPNSFIFHHDLVNGLPPANDSPVTVPVVVLNGLPAGYSVLVEAVLQVEGLYSINSQSQNTSSAAAATAAPPSSFTRVFNSVEHMWDTIRPWLPAPATVQTAVSLANRLLGPPPLERQTRYLPSSVTGRLLP